MKYAQTFTVNVNEIANRDTLERIDARNVSSRAKCLINYNFIKN